MIALEIRLNNKRICVAGADDLSVLTASVAAVGKLGKKTIPLRPDDTTGEIHYSVGGLRSRPNPNKDVHLRWKSVDPLKIGDVLQIKITETEKVDRPVSTSKAKRNPAVKKARR